MTSRRLPRRRIEPGSILARIALALTRIEIWQAATGTLPRRLKPLRAASGGLEERDWLGPARSPRGLLLSSSLVTAFVFIQTVVNGLHNTPFFVTRFREALFYYLAIFDILDATAPRDNEQRLVVERDLIGRCAMNVIACEGLDRVEHPETYRQWQVRNH